MCVRHACQGFWDQELGNRGETLLDRPDESDIGPRRFLADERRDQLCRNWSRNCCI